MKNATVIYRAAKPEALICLKLVKTEVSEGQPASASRPVEVEAYDDPMDYCPSEYEPR